MDNYKNYSIVLIHDIAKCKNDAKICVTGIVNDKWSKKKFNRFGIMIKDITGFVKIRLSAKQYFQYRFAKGQRVRIYASVVQNDGECYLQNVVDVEFLKELNQWSRDYNITEQESLVLISKICNIIRARLTDLNFVEVKTRIISRYIGDEILEPLLADFPGYGSPAYLSPSPSAQLSEFLAVTLLPRVFTETVSITSSYRFPNASSETPIIMAKAINLSANKEKDIMLGISRSIISSLSDRNYVLETNEMVWGNDVVESESFKKDTFSYCTYLSNIPAIGSKWSSVVTTIRQLKDDKGNLLAESAIEVINENSKINTVTFYPTQYLSYMQKAPRRQLLNLWKLYEGRNIYV